MRTLTGEGAGDTPLYYLYFYLLFLFIITSATTHSQHEHVHTTSGSPHTAGFLLLSPYPPKLRERLDQCHSSTEPLLKRKRTQRPNVMIAGKVDLSLPCCASLSPVGPAIALFEGRDHI